MMDPIMILAGLAIAMVKLDAQWSISLEVNRVQPELMELSKHKLQAASLKQQATSTRIK
jgi:hypothetical protein